MGQDAKEAAQEKPITNVQEPGWENPFSDVLPGAWYYDAVSFIAAKGITSGTTATTFSPDATLTRGQFITLLMRAYDIKPNTNNNDNFSDAGNTYYTEYLATAKQLGLTKGIGDNKYAPEQAVTRQEMFTLLYNALKSLDSALATAARPRGLYGRCQCGELGRRSHGHTGEIRHHFRQQRQTNP